MYMAILITKLNFLWHMDKLFYFGTTGNWYFRNGSHNAKYTFMKSWTTVDDIQKDNDCSQIYMIKLCQKKKKKRTCEWVFKPHFWSNETKINVLICKSACLPWTLAILPEWLQGNNHKTWKWKFAGLHEYKNIWGNNFLYLCCWILKKWLPI